MLLLFGAPGADGISINFMGQAMNVMENTVNSAQMKYKGIFSSRSQLPLSVISWIHLSILPKDAG